MKEEVLSILDKLSIPYQLYTHPAVYTMEEAMKYWTEDSGVHCKNLFLRNHKGDKHFLILLHHQKTLDVKSFSFQLENKVMSFASAERLMNFLKLTQGSVSPFGLIHDNGKHVQVIIDEQLKESDRICFHPNTNTASVSLLFSDFIKFLDWTGNVYSFLKL